MPFSSRQRAHVEKKNQCLWESFTTPQRVLSKIAGCQSIPITFQTLSLAVFFGCSVKSRGNLLQEQGPGSDQFDSPPCPPSFRAGYFLKSFPADFNTELNVVQKVSLKIFLTNPCPRPEIAPLKSKGLPALLSCSSGCARSLQPTFIPLLNAALTKCWLMPCSELCPSVQ